MENNKLAGPLKSKAKLKNLQEEYTIILSKIIAYINKRAWSID